MATEFKLPELGENIDSADIIKVMISEGDKVEKDQNVIEIETDKATVEVPSDITGTVKKVNVKEGDSAKVGDVIFSVEEGKGEENNESEKEETEEKTEEKKESSDDGKEKEKNEEKENVKAEAEVEPEVKEEEESSEGESVEFKVPDLGENIESADVIKVLVSEGDEIKKDDPVIEIETDKATVEVPSEVSGKITKLNVKEGDKVKVDDVILVVESSGEKKETKKEKKEEPRKEEKKEEKKSEEKKEEKREEKKDVKAESKYSPSVKSTEMPKKIAPAAPSVRRFAREIGIDIHQVSGTGPGGRISIDDVKAHSKNMNEKISKGGGGFGIPQEALPDFSKFGEINREKMSNVRRKTAEHLSYAWATIPHVTQFDKADITEIEKLRKQFGKKAEEAGGKLTVTAILLKIIASALKVFPQFNASVDMNNKEIIYKKYYNIGIAVDTDRGLIVPVVRDVDKKNLVELSVELSEIAEKARNKKVTLEDMQGGNFSISNLGGIGGTYFTPVVNSPEVAILGVSRGAYEPVYKDGEFVPRLMLPLSLSYDHRIIDGADAIKFLRWVATALEQPFTMMLEG